VLCCGNILELVTSVVNNINTSPPVKGIDVYPHMPILRPHAARYIASLFKFHERRISSVTFTSTHLYGNVYMRVGVARAPVDSSDFGLLGEQSSQTFCDSLPWTPMNRRAKFDAASFILGGEIRNRTNTQTLNDIPTPCLSACVDNLYIIIGLSRWPRGVPYEACGYKQAGQTDGRADGQADGPNRAKIAILARNITYSFIDQLDKTQTG